MIEQLTNEIYELNDEAEMLELELKRHRAEYKKQLKLLMKPHEDERKLLMANKQLVNELKQLPDDDYEYVFWNNNDEVIAKALQKTKRGAGYKVVELPCERCGNIDNRRALDSDERDYWEKHSKRWLCDECEKYYQSLIDGMDYRQYLRSDHWTTFAAKTKQQRTTCEKCGNNEQLQVHHLHYDTLFHEAAEDVLVLCKKCHSECH